MQALAVVEHLDVLEGRGLHRSRVAEALPVDPLILEAVEPALGRRVIPAVPLAAHRADHAVFLQLVLEGVAGVLAAPVGVMHQPRGRLPAEPGHGQRIGHDVRRHARFQRPADDLAVEQIQHDGQVEPAFIGPQVGDVGRPDLIRCGRGEVPLQQVLGHRQGVLGVGRDLVAALVAGPDAVLAHQPLHPFLAGREAACTQLPHHARAAVGALEFGMNGVDQRQHLGVRQPLAIRRAATLPGPIAADADRQHRAQSQHARRPLRCPSIQAYFTGHPSRSTPSLFLGFRPPA